MEELLLKLKANNTSIRVVDDHLKISVPKGFNDADFINEIKENKESLIKYIKEKRSIKKTAAISQAPKKESYRLTPPQLRLFLLDQLNNNSLAYNLPGVFWMEGILNCDRLEYAFKTLIERHESLRTSFSIDKNNEPVQKISEEFSFKIETFKGDETDIATIIEDFIKPFDLNQAPLLRVGLINISEEKHILLFDIHHIISDGTSTGILIKELVQLYSGQDLPKLKLQYKDFSEWYLSDDFQASVSQQKDFWSQKFSDIQSPLELPTDFSRPKTRMFGGGSSKFSITKKETEQLRQLSRKNNTTLFTVLLGIYSIMLSKLSNNQDLVIGTPVAGRKHDDLQDIIGMFVNTLALPLHVSNDISFTTYLAELHEKVLAYFDNADYPYERLINDLQIERDPSRNPLFDVEFAFQNMDKESMQMETMQIREYERETTTTKFDLILDACEESSILNFNFEYATELFTASTIKKFICFFKHVMNQVLQHEEGLLSEVSLLSEKEAQTLINFDQVNYPKEATLVSLFEEQVVKNPNKEALVFEGTSLSYFELNNLSNTLAENLRAKGVGRDSIVGLLMDKNLHTVVCLLGILKSGGCYLPIDPSYPKERINYMIKDSDLKILVTNKMYEDLIKTSIDKIVIEDTINDLLGKEEVPNLNHINHPEDLCYIIYTSGTTGNPKGVMVEHKNVVRLLFNDKFQFDFGKDDVWTMFHSHCFDVSVWEMYGSLLYGGKLIIISQDDARDPSRYLDILKENKVTVLNQTPTAFDSLKNACKKENIVLPNIRYVVFAGEALTPLKLKEWNANHPKAKLINMYGITEVTVHTTYKEIGKKEIESNISNIGTPIPTSSLYLLDANQNLVPQGVIGELYVVGDGVTRGYLNKEALTAARFIENPYQKGQRLYRSGDLGRLLSNGEIEYLGRIDKQVQLKGFRIELKEIEHHLLLHELIDESVVIKRDSDQDQPYLCAYYTGKETIEVNSLRTYLGKHLPHYMIPSYFVRLDDIPFTSNNKVAIAKLPEPETGLLSQNYIAPTNEWECLVCEIWEKELGLEQVGISDNFFSIGGDSLKAIGLMSTINKELGTSLTIADLYSYQTIEELMVIQDSKNVEEEEQAIEAAKEELQVYQESYKEAHGFSDSYEEVYPMNGVEMGMIFYSLQTKSDNIHDILYHEQNLYDLPERDFDFEKFKKVIGLLCQKHGELRKIFDLDNLAHIIKKTIDSEINFINICHLNKEEQKQFITEKMHEERLRGTELSFSVIWRMSIIKIRSDYQYLLFDFNHALFDGWSLSSFLTELQRIYLSLSEDENYLPQKLQSSYEDQIIGELAASKKESSIQYWKEALNDYTRFELQPTGLAHECLSDEFKFGKAYRKELETVAKKHHTTFKHLCFSAYVYTLRMLSYGSDITTGIATNIRPLVQDAEQLLGCFLNTIPFRINIPEGLTWGEYIGHVETKLRELKYHERVPFHKILEIVEEERNEKNPIFDVFFNYVDFRIFDEMQPSEETIEAEETTLSKDYLNDHALLTTHVFAHENDFNFILTYSTSFITKEQAKIIANYFKNTLDQFIYHADTVMDKQVILKETSDLLKLQESKISTTIAYPKADTLVRLFEEQVAKNPNKKALVFENTSLTYLELNNLANILAENLRSKGIGRDSLVGLLMDKNLDTVVCQLGILKSGGCYLPIDPSYPKERIDYIVEDSHLNIVVTNKAYQDVLGTSIFQMVLEEVIAASSNKESVPNLEHINHPEDLCYIIYTSGTTGNPKGVMVEHRNVVRLFFNDEFQFDFGNEDVWTMFHSHCFDFSVWEMYGALLYGGKLVIVSQNDARDPMKYLEILKAHKVTVLNQTPTAFNSLKNICASEHITLSDLRYIIFGGEALIPSKLKEWHDSHPSVKLINMYGITEITVHATYKEIGTEEIENNISNIGTPIPTTSLYLLDSDKNLQPQGVIGEIYIGGAGVTRGYLNKQELTAARFIENPYCKGERLYRSGDLGRLLKNGDVEYLGRIDNQVQLKGFRIELKEIEHHLLRHEQIEESVVVLKGTEKEQPYLCAYYVSKGHTELNDLKAYLGTYLPNYMIPSYIVRLDNMPFTSNNKIAISKLPEPDAGVLKDAYVPPTNKRELIMCKVWGNELGLEKVGIRDNYFSLGGDSLKAIGLISKINKELKTSFSIADLYSYQTIEELVGIQNSEKAEKEQAIQDAKEALRLFQEQYKKEHGFLEAYEEVFPMNGVEMGMVFHSLQTKSDNIHDILYHEQNLYDIPDKDFDFEKFKKVINLICAKHGELRKIFDLDHLAHIIKKEIDPEISFIDICHLNKEEQEQFIEEKMHKEKLRGTDLSFSVIWRMSIIKIRSDYQYLLFDFNHALFDGWSLSSFMTELQKLSLSVSKDENYVPKTLQSSYEDQIIGELAAVKKESTITYWKEELDDYTRFELPPTGMKHEYFRDEFKFGKKYRKELEKVADKYNTSFKHLCFSAYIYMLKMFSYGNDITAGITTNIRPLVHDAEQLLGCFLNTIPFRAKIPEGLTWGEYIDYIETKLRELKYHEHAPFYKILEIVKEVSSEKNPVFDVSFNYVDFRIFNELQPFEETIKEEETTLSKAYMNDYALLGVHIRAFNNGFDLELAYSTSFITQEQVKILSSYFKSTLDQFIHQADALMEKDVILKEGGDGLGVLEANNTTTVNHEKDQTVLDLFQEQVSLTPDAEALIFEEESLTYGGLDKRSNLWATHLISSGIEPGSVVGLRMTRSIEMITAILAIMKAGATYMVLDPELPSSRLVHMIEESSCSCIITNITEQPIALQAYSWIDVEALDLDNKMNVHVKLPKIMPESLAYILYTSGSTGKPKGCMISHANLFHYIFWSNGYYFKNAEHGHWGLMTPMSFDLTITAIFTSLTRGKRLYICDERKGIDQLLADCFNNPAIDTLKLTPTHVTILKDLKIQNTNVRTVICGGEQLKKTHIETLKNINEDIKVYNEYGPTETTVGCSVTEITRADDKISVGSPIANTKMYILDIDRKAVPMGIVGEMYISGAGVSKGYIGNAALTAERFVSIDDSICYKTGDLGRWDSQGNIEYIGRVDDQIKIRGYRVELGEIEAALENLPFITQAFVTDYGADENKQLCAYLIGDDELKTEQLKNTLASILPVFMIPAVYIWMDDFPLTPNGKIDKKALPIPDYESEEKYIAPETAEEQRMVTIWSEILAFDASKNRA